MHDHDAVLAMINGIRDEFDGVIPIAEFDKKPVYIDFEVVSRNDYLNEGYLT